jgi:hypothetical protein
MDFVVRSTRLVARNVVYAVEDGEPRPVSAAVVRDVLRGVDLLGRSLEDISLQPAAQELLLSVASRLDPATLMPDASLRDQQVIAGMRPIVVDLLTATGMPAADARAALPSI